MSKQFSSYNNLDALFTSIGNKIRVKPTVIRISKNDYDALTSTEKHDTSKAYYIYDWDPAPIQLIDDTVVAADQTWSSRKISQQLDGKISGVSVNGTDVTPDANHKVALTIMTNTVNNLINYYLKSETYTKTEVDSLIGAISTITFEVVNTLPTTNIKTNVIYLVPKSSSQTSNIKDEYINLDGTSAGWEKIGDTEIDLSDYITTDDLNSAIAVKPTVERMTQAEYNALTSTQKHDTTKAYYLYDVNNVVGTSIKIYTATSNGTTVEFTGVDITKPHILEPIYPNNYNDNIVGVSNLQVTNSNTLTYTLTNAINNQVIKLLEIG